MASRACKQRAGLRLQLRSRCICRIALQGLAGVTSTPHLCRRHSCLPTRTLGSVPTTGLSAEARMAASSASICADPSSFLGLGCRRSVTPAAAHAPSSCTRMSVFLGPASACISLLVNTSTVSEGAWGAQQTAQQACLLPVTPPSLLSRALARSMCLAVTPAWHPDRTCELISQQPQVQAGGLGVGDGFRHAACHNRERRGIGKQAALLQSTGGCTNHQSAAQAAAAASGGWGRGLCRGIGACHATRSRCCVSARGPGDGRASQGADRKLASRQAS